MGRILVEIRAHGVDCTARSVRVNSKDVINGVYSPDAIAIAGIMDVTDALRGSGKPENPIVKTVMRYVMPEDLSVRRLTFLDACTALHTPVPSRDVESLNMISTPIVTTTDARRCDAKAGASKKKMGHPIAVPV